MKNNCHIRSKLSALSLRARLIVIFLCLLIAASITLGVLYSQSKKTMDQTIQLASLVHASILEGSQLTAILSEAHLKLMEGQRVSYELEQFGVLLNRLEEKERNLVGNGEFSPVLSEVRKGFQDFTQIASSASPNSEFKNRLSKVYFSALDSIDTFNKKNQELSNDLLGELKAHQEAFTLLMIKVLGGFVIVALIASMRLISSVTHPILRAVAFLDEFNVEEDFHNVLTKLNAGTPEISRIFASVDNLLSRFKIYRDFNVRRLLKEKRRADIIAASISDGIFLLHGDEVLYVNPIAEKILGFNPGQFRKGLKLSEESRSDNSSGIAAVKRAVSRTIPVEFSLSLLDEKKYYYLIQSFPISYDLIEKIEDNGQGSSIRDYSDRIQADTLVLAQDVTLVKEGQEAKSHFLATLSHEIKTPVTSLTMATRLLKKSVEQFPNPTHQNLITTCADDVDRLRRLLEDLLTVSRFDTLTQRLEFQNIDLGKLLVHSVQSFQVQAKERGVELTHQVLNHGKPLLVTMDATKIAWALSNLLTNALRHSPRGGKVEVRLEALDGWTELRVKDSGPGIDRHRQDKIFDKFNSYYDLRIARSGSIGAGLAIAKEIVVAHGGKIWVVSEPGKGAEFCFKLPLKGNDLGTRADHSLGQQYEIASERFK